MRDSSDVKVTSGIAIISFVLILFIKGPNFQKNFFDAFSSALTITIACRYFYIKWLWKRIPFNKFLHKTPNIEGSWRGEFTSTWKDSDNEDKNATGPIEVKVTQSDIFSIKITQKTNESISYSFGEQFDFLEDGSLYLNFSYRNEPIATVRERSPISYGTVRYLLKENNGKMKLAGDYFTDRKTTGHIVLTKTKKEN